MQRAVAVHGMQGPLERQKHESFSNPRMSHRLLNIIDLSIALQFMIPMVLCERKSMKTALGLDFGTTNSALARQRLDRLCGPVAEDQRGR
jgi:hypothetical protein